MALTPEQELEAIDEAIQRALKSQEYEIGNRRNVRPNLDALFKRKDQLLRQIADQADGCSMSSLGVID